MPDSAGARLVAAIVRKDRDGVRATLHPSVDFKGLTPGQMWEASSRDDVVAMLFDQWFEPTDEIERLVSLEEGPPVIDTQRIGYRIAVRNDDGPHLVEQQAYYREEEGLIHHLRVVCSGFRPESA